METFQSPSKEAISSGPSSADWEAVSILDPPTDLSGISTLQQGMRSAVGYKSNFTKNINLYEAAVDLVAAKPTMEGIDNAKFLSRKTTQTMHKLTRLYEHIMSIDYENADTWEKKIEESIVRYNKVNADTHEPMASARRVVNEQLERDRERRRNVGPDPYGGFPRVPSAPTCPQQQQEGAAAYGYPGSMKASYRQCWGKMPIQPS